ncbi:carbohydrate ABC transporter substrate-binding protein, CUT1 family [Caloramator quimbayensis]|uniref:Carbohydrate ABC transporter substrate-binding protein, CUT1 family n=1 Tax=Caloramator quimbayensis TaxID=1147123 RepID=A0A1T4YGE1_9CLOT|nr:ABC transporter substrate-binding protein [Caloramator quimbayensis]SKB00730.1 carbohydrate ABC transporter substrate-binding protein, CUT1 family [Caloramator quimbayensis]
MKKIISFVLSILLIVGLFSGCGKSETSNNNTNTNTNQTQNEQKVLKVWSFTDEVKTMTVAFQGKNPNVKIEYTMIPMTNGEYQTKLKSALQAGEGPDVVTLEASFVREFIESDYLEDLSDLLPVAKDLKTYQFTIDMGTYEGVTKAFSYQATPGAYFYRRSLAKKYFGTDDPEKIQELVSDMKKFEQAAKVIKEKSKGNTYMVASVGDFTNLFFANREKPWVVDDNLVIDPKVDELFEIAKSFRQNGYEAQANQWQEGWFAGMNDSLVDAKGNPKQIFSYILPTWGLPYVLMPNSAPKEVKVEGSDKTKTVGKNTAGDWACIKGPMPYQWGGTWIAAVKGTKNLDLAKEFIKFATLDEENLKNWALGVYTNEYLKKIDPTIGDKLAQGAGDFVSSQKVVEEIASQFDNAETSKFLSGQNSYKSFAEAAPNISLKLIQGTDDAIQRALNDPLSNYASGKATKEQAMKQFKDAVKNALPDLNVQ